MHKVKQYVKNVHIEHPGGHDDVTTETLPYEFRPNRHRHWGNTEPYPCYV